METIQKKICFERYRSRTQGLVPYIAYGDNKITYVSKDNTDGNWGGFPVNPTNLVDSGKTYMDVMVRYFSIWKQLRNGTYLKKISVSSECDCAPVGLSWTEKFNWDEYVDRYDFDAYDKEYFYYNDETETYFLIGDEPDGLADSDHIVLVDDVDDMFSCASYLNYTNWSDFCRFVDDVYIGKVVIPDEVKTYGDRVPNVMYYVDMVEYLEWLTDNENSSDCCVKELWERMGGSRFKAYLDEQLSNSETRYADAMNMVGSDSGACIPTIDIQLALTQNYADEGLYTAAYDTPYDSYNGDELNSYSSGGSVVEDVDRSLLSWPYSVETRRWEADTDDDGYVVPSYLPELMKTPYFYDDNRVKIPGTLHKFTENGGQPGFFKCTYTVGPSGETYWSISSQAFNPSFVVADGEPTSSCKNQNKYRTLTMLSTLYSLVPSPYNIDGDMSQLSNGDYFYFLVTYNNGVENPATIPFEMHTPKNATSVEGENGIVMGDIVLSADTTSSAGYITLTYVIGGKFDYGGGYRYIDDTGTILKETHPYEEGKKMEFVIDGVSGAVVYCDYIDFEADAKIGVSSYNGLSGLCTTSIITAMTTGDVWSTKSGAIRSTIYKEDYLLGIAEEPKTDIDVSYDNGTESIWERHFKLSECNTFEDVSEYGNGYFNVQ